MAVLSLYSTIPYRHVWEPANWTRKVRQVGWTAPTLEQVFPPHLVWRCGYDFVLRVPLDASFAVYKEECEWAMVG